MSDQPTPAQMNRATPRRGSPSLVWLAPILALLVTLGIAWNAYASRGTLIKVEFADATGITAGETALKFREITVGKVESVAFTQDLKKVVVAIRVDRDVAPYIDSRAQFWIVRPQVSTQGISRLDTVLSGVFIEGYWTAEQTGDGQTRFAGLDKPPLAVQDARGTWVVISSDNAQSLTEGAPVLFRGLRVGQMQNLRLSEEDESVLADVFIEAPHDKRLSTATAFWDTSGFSLSLGAQGIAFNVSSMAALLQGGVQFETMTSGGKPVEPGHVFKLNPDEQSARLNLFEGTGNELRMTVLVDGSVKGLSKGAEVQYQGLPVGSVTDLAVSVRQDPEGRAPLVLQQVTIALSPERLGLAGDADAEAALAFLQRRVRDESLRARLASAGFLGTSLMIELAQVTDAPPAEIDMAAQPFPVIPSVAGDLTDFTASAQGALTRIGKLPIEETLKSATDMFNSVTALTAQDSTREVPAKVAQMVDEANATLTEIRQVAADLKASGAMENIGKMVDEASAAAEAVKLAAADVPDMVQKIDAAAAKVGEVSFAGISAEAVALLADVRAMIGTKDAEELPKNLSDTLKAASGLLTDLRDGNAAGSLNQALASARVASDEVALAARRLPDVARRFEQLAARADQVVAAYGERSAFNSEALNMMRELKRATAAFGSLARTIERNPRAFILGR
ncbi:MAG: MlaD family protein [Paracoccus sp. (in: a-proteobacteria)]|nr:MlaD family protein [Paracoccus sp. (in: a-proteobacteria)]